MANERNELSSWQYASRLIGVGFYIGGTIVSGVLIGRYLDGRMNTRPFFALTGLVVGLAIALYGVYEMLLPLIRQRRRKR